MLHIMYFHVFTALIVATVSASTLQHHADVNHDVLMKLVERVDRQELEMKKLVGKLNRQEQKMKKLEAEVAVVRLENKQLKSDIQTIGLKLNGQTISTITVAEQNGTKFHYGNHSITKRQVQQGNWCLQGPQGPPGKDGRDGKDGKDGKDGIQNPGLTVDSLKQIIALLGYQSSSQVVNSSRSSVQGPQGLPGRDGRDGIQGPPGPKGDPGSLTLDTLKQMLGQIGAQIGVPPTGLPANTSHGGTVYTRWGRTTCSTYSQLLYKGISAGTYYSKTGGGSNYLCLPQTPEWGKYQDGGQDLGSYIHGVQYEYVKSNIFSKSNTGGHNLPDQDAPCAVCYTQTRPSHVMIPAKKTCPAGWTTEYNGYLVSNRDDYARTEFVCLDEAPEVVAGGHEDKIAASFYTAEAKCGTLPCPPYVDGRELACVVCTK
ncbi:macrophage scavenger receptor types I and II isoform X3 [Lingula anatina]|uniref:Macrophage scavenger receptor types I and II isoform X3 n=1 Tax=Lingula anatina TaxID=7574 RepID=A0A2R2MJ83_LINAN|nr:macrophage scavenger receptor types I and II isoform X3 [Lingula anatina]|eukprot:XP_023930268.1 macrophage scavenger receptor types I and II isoform X3 [Lingula anatina]